MRSFLPGALAVALLFPVSGCTSSNADGGSCPRTPAPADRARHVVVSHPYDDTGAEATGYEVLDLSASGALTRPGRRFQLGRATQGAIAFTPDGKVGLVAQVDGTVGVFTLDATGVPAAVHAGFDGGFFASQIVVDPSGDRAWVLDERWRENGGGIYGLGIGCDGELTSTGLVAAAKMPAALSVFGNRALVAAADILGSVPGNDVHLLEWSDAPTLLVGVDAFGDDDAVVGGAALSADGGTYLVGDVNALSSVPNRVAVVAVEPSGLQVVNVVSPVEDPQAIALSPFGDVAVVASGLGEALIVLDGGGAGGTWQVRGEVVYQGAGPQLPSEFAMISRGQLQGRVLVAEVTSIRQLAFRASGEVEDVGSLPLGSGFDHIVGAVGVTP